MTSDNRNSALKALIDACREISRLDGIRSLLSWDQETYMPKAAIHGRAEQQALIATLVHQRQTSPDFTALLDAWISTEEGTLRAEAKASLTEAEQRLVQEIYRDWKNANALPESFVREHTKLLSKSQHAWQEAKENNTFETFAPYLKEVVEKSKEKASYLNQGEPLYDTLLDEFEPGMTNKELKQAFDPLAHEIKHILAQVRDVTPTHKQRHPVRYARQKQWAFGMKVLADIGFDFDRGRQDKSAHPFTTNFDCDDTRITTRLDEGDLIESLSNTIHEAGHALYDQGLDRQWWGTPFGQATSLGIHESQSRFWENIVAKSLPFWHHYFSDVRQAFPDAVNGQSAHDYYRQINQVAPSLIRVAADEVTYNLHIIIRFELELALVNGQLDVDQLRDAWSDAYHDALGVRPRHDAEGVLQDVHWSMGALGYFPTYTLGNLYAAQFTKALEAAIGPLSEYTEKGAFKPILDWLRQHIHCVGRRRNAKEMLQDVAGESLSSQAFLAYIKAKYSDIYQINL